MDNPIGKEALARALTYCTANSVAKANVDALALGIDRAISRFTRTATSALVSVNSTSLAKCARCFAAKGVNCNDSFSLETFEVAAAFTSTHAEAGLGCVGVRLATEAQSVSGASMHAVQAAIAELKHI